MGHTRFRRRLILFLLILFLPGTLVVFGLGWLIEGIGPREMLDMILPAMEGEREKVLQD